MATAFFIPPMNRRDWLLLSTAALLPLPGYVAEPTVSVFDRIESRPDLSTLARMLAFTQLDELLRRGGPFTVFAPTNEAFRALLPTALDQIADVRAMRAALMRHIVARRLVSGDIQAEMLTMLSGAQLEVVRTGGILATEGAIATEPDLVAANGVIHVVDTVLLPARR